MSAATADRLKALLTPSVAGTGLDLETVDVTHAGRRRLVRVAVDKDGGVSLDDVATVARVVSEALDASDVMGAQPYVLEVTSPGVDRPLTEPRHWRRSVGRLVKVDLVSGSSVTGRVEAADADGVDLDVERARPAAGLRRGPPRQGRGRVQPARSGRPRRGRRGRRADDSTDTDGEEG